MPDKDTFDNRAILGDHGMRENECVDCDDPLIFAMKDKTHEFSMGLFTVLECLKLAEEQGSVPKLPDGWWLQLAQRHFIRF